jgi:hypothetical protein
MRWSDGMAGYSGTPLPQKLGIKEGHLLAFLSAPKQFKTALGALPVGVKVADKLGGAARYDVVVLFVTELGALKKGFGKAAKSLQPNGGLWIGWPKKSSGVATDVDENKVRAIALAEGLVDNKVCAIDETWSGLRCVIRVKDRPK